MGAVTFSQASTFRSDRLAENDRRDLGDQMEGLAPTAIEFFGVGIVIILYGIGLADGYAMVDLLNIVGPLLFTVTVGYSALRLTRRNTHAIWTPVFWYRVTMAVYLGIGSGMTSFFNAETRDLINSLFAFTNFELLKFNMVNAVFHFCFISVSWVVIRMSRTTGQKSRIGQLAIEKCRIPLRTVGMVFLLIGLTANYLLIYPAALGLLPLTVSNVANQFGQLAYLGYFLITYWGLTNRQYRWVWAMIALAAIDAVAGLLLLSKFSAMFPVIMIPIGFLYHRTTVRRVIIAMAFLVPFYMVVSAVVEEARSRVLRDGSDLNRAVFSDTVKVVGDIATGRDKSPDASEYQLAWARLNYANAGTLGISMYDQGMAGNSLRDIFVVWIPRFVYPDKPIITDIARDFTVMANGNYNSSTSPSMPSEGYWNFGWLGVALFSMMLSIVLTLWSVYSTIVFDRGAWHLLLAVLLGMRIGTRIDGMFVPDVVGPLSAVIAIHIGCTLANRFLPRIPALQRRFVY